MHTRVLHMVVVLIKHISVFEVRVALDEIGIQVCPGTDWLLADFFRNYWEFIWE